MANDNANNVSQAPVAWSSLTATTVSASQSSNPIAINGTTLNVNSKDLLEFDLDVYAPRITDQQNLSGTTPSLYLKLMADTLQLKVVSPYYAINNRNADGSPHSAVFPVTMDARLSQDGTSNHNLKVTWDSTQGRESAFCKAPSGDYPFTIYAGDKPLANFTLHYTNTDGACGGQGD